LLDLFRFVLRLSALIILQFHTLNENILLSHRDFSIQYQFPALVISYISYSIPTNLYFIHPSQLPSPLSLSQFFIFCSSPSYPPFGAHSLTSSPGWASCRPVPPLPYSRRCRRPVTSPSAAARGRRWSAHGELRSDDIRRPCSRPSLTRQPLSTWTRLVSSLLVSQRRLPGLTGIALAPPLGRGGSICASVTTRPGKYRTTA
jgi:hypothetical protein